MMKLTKHDTNILRKIMLLELISSSIREDITRNIKWKTSKESKQIMQDLNNKILDIEDLIISVGWEKLFDTKTLKKCIDENLELVDLITEKLNYE